MENVESSNLVTPSFQPHSEIPKLFFVGAFPPPEKIIFGGMVTDCRILLNSSLVNKVDLIQFDSTQVDNPIPSFAKRLILSIKRLFSYIVSLERLKPDAVLLFAAPGASIVEKGVMAWFAKSRGIPSLLFPRGGGLMRDFHSSYVNRVYISLAMAGASKILCQGETWQKFAISDLERKSEDVCLVHNWTATADLLEIGRTRNVSYSDGAIRVLFVGWLDQEKGVLDLLNVCKKLKDKYDFKLDLVGKGNAFVLAKQYVNDAGLIGFVNFYGWLHGDALLQAYRDADIFVLPSWMEGLPNSMIEAMAARLSIVVTSVGAIPDVIIDEYNGLLIEPRSPAQLQRAIERLIVDSSLRIKVSRNAYETAQVEFEVEKAVDSIVAIVNEVKNVYK